MFSVSGLLFISPDVSSHKSPRRRKRRAPAALILGASVFGLAHAAPAQILDRPGPSQPQPRPPEFRTYSGDGNNFRHPDWGSAGSDYLRERSGAHYTDGRSTPAGASRPSARLISNLVADQGTTETQDSRGMTACVYEFGQFLDHDFGLAKGGTTEPFNIAVPLADPSFDPAATGTQIIPFTRSAFDPFLGRRAPRQQINTVTAFIDGSQIYGSDAVRADWLRSHTGGRLKVVSTPFGEMLPYNDGSLTNDNPLNLPTTSLYAAGDSRANEQPGLTTLHLVFLREHNFQADRLHAANPRWNDERIYQEARRIVGAELQVITYKEFIPALLGQELPPYRGYQPNVHAGLSNAFATAAYRIGHSMVGPDIDLLDAQFNPVGIVDLANGFFNPTVIPNAGGPEPILRYMATSTSQRIDTTIVDPLRNFLFGPPGAGGLDLAALNIQRGRDHGLADYNTMRTDYGLPRVTSFADITSDIVLAQKLQQLYGNVNNIDPWVGLLAEDHLRGSSVGQTHWVILAEQFIRLRDGDRFWYQNLGLPHAQVAALEATTLTQIVERNTRVTGLQANMFLVAP